MRVAAASVRWWWSAVIAAFATAAGVVVLSLGVVPLHVTYGAGNVRCGTAVSPYNGRDCERAAAKRRTATLPMAGGTAAVSCIRWLSVGRLRRKWTRLAAVVACLCWSLFVIAIVMTIVGFSEDLSV